MLESQSVFYYKFGTVLLMPAFFGGGLLIFWLMAAKIYKLTLNEAMKNFLQSQIIIITFLLSSIINALADFVNCTTINNEDYNVSYLTVQCTNNETYLFWRSFYIIPSFIFYALLLPIIAFVFMYKNRMKLFELDVVPKISFLMNGYRQEFYYW